MRKIKRTTPGFEFGYLEWEPHEISRLGDIVREKSLLYEKYCAEENFGFITDTTNSGLLACATLVAPTVGKEQLQSMVIDFRFAEFQKNNFEDWFPDRRTRRISSFLDALKGTEPRVSSVHGFVQWTCEQARETAEYAATTFPDIWTEYLRRIDIYGFAGLELESQFRPMAETLFPLPNDAFIGFISLAITQYLSGSRQIKALAPVNKQIFNYLLDDYYYQSSQGVSFEEWSRRDDVLAKLDELTEQSSGAKERHV